MPSAFAHALVGSSLASLLPEGKQRIAAIALLGALAAAPDLDVIAFRFGIPYEHALGHRGFSHSLFFALLCGLASLPLWRRFLRRRAGVAAALTFAAMASHGLLDTLTDAGFGVGLLLPFESTRYFAPWRPIETSPLSVYAFLNGPGLGILANEIIWIGIPTACFLAAARSLRNRSSGADSND